VPGRPTISLQANEGGETAGVGTDVGAGSVGAGVVGPGAVGVVGPGAAQAARRSAARAIAPRRATGMRFFGRSVFIRAGDADDPVASRVGRHEGERPAAAGIIRA